MKTIIAISLAGALTAGVTGASAVSANAATLFSNSHAAWCEQNYRSYNSATDTFIGSDGLAHRCISPSGGTVTFGAVGPFAFVPDNSTGLARQNPNGFGSGTTYRVFPGDDVNGTPDQGDPKN